MCDYRFKENDPTSFCKRAPQFWVQSLLSTHNSLVCAHHLARTVRDIEQEARKFDLCVVGEDAPDMRYLRKDGHDGKISQRVTREHSNWARVTVKPYQSRSK